MPHTYQEMDPRNKNDVYTQLLDAQVSAIKVHLRDEYNTKVEALQKDYEGKIEALQKAHQEQLEDLNKKIAEQKLQIDNLIEVSRNPVHRGVQIYNQHSQVSVRRASQQEDSQSVSVTVRKLLNT